ncbi:MAG: glycogen debranching enzyme family protein, partial [Deltaproteobacteria bacterium]|nr:glycogen debranching enzyme family protein [Candidatus Tharpellaceae bacterium]
SLREGQKTLGNEKSLAAADGNHFTLFKPRAVPGRHRSLSLELAVYNPEKTEHVKAPLLLLSKLDDVRIKKQFNREEILHTPLLLLGTNGRGAMMRTSILWTRINSRYDALLAANLDPEIPVDRQIMFSRCRAWVVFQGYSQAINGDCLHSFTFDYHSAGQWNYRIPTGQGEHVHLMITMGMASGNNKIRLTFSRPESSDNDRHLDNQQRVTLILRPDIEDRNFHQTTKAYLGAESQWPAAVNCQKDGFIFRPSTDHWLQMNISTGQFIQQSEWLYMVHRPLEAERGLDPDSDLFSPGYFTTTLAGSETVELAAEVLPSTESPAKKTGLRKIESSAAEDENDGKPFTLEKDLKLGLEHYLVKRGKFQSVIAGYPWFLDWGRDSLIVTRGLIAAGKIEEAKAILLQFGRFEEHGTLPNMIQGEKAANRDTADAPLWFMVAINDILKAENSHGFLETRTDNRTIRQIIFSIGSSLIIGTDHGVRMDPEPGLLFSPAHFSWMDTNYPAATPRQGYPIEIQALWHASLSLLARLDPQGKEGPWLSLVEQVQNSIEKLFWLKEEGFLADCLHSQDGSPAGQAVADDALRPN